MHFLLQKMVSQRKNASEPRRFPSVIKVWVIRLGFVLIIPRTFEDQTHRFPHEQCCMVESWSQYQDPKPRHKTLQGCNLLIWKVKYRLEATVRTNAQTHKQMMYKAWKSNEQLVIPFSFVWQNVMSLLFKITCIANNKERKGTIEMVLQARFYFLLSFIWLGYTHKRRLIF